MTEELADPFEIAPTQGKNRCHQYDIRSKLQVKAFENLRQGYQHTHSGRVVRNPDAADDLVRHLVMQVILHFGKRV